MSRFVCLCLVLGFAAGCVNVRYSAIPKVNCSDANISTKFRYRLSSYLNANGEPISFDQFDENKEFLENHYPNVFADNGIPIVIGETEQRNVEVNYAMTCLFPCLLSAMTLPGIMEEVHDTGFFVKHPDAEDCRGDYEIHFEKGTSVTVFTPLACFFWNGTPEMNGYRGFYKTVFNEGVTDSNRLEIARLAIGYGAAVKLKGLEEAGRIDPEKLKRKVLSQVPVQQNSSVQQRQSVEPQVAPISVNKPSSVPPVNVRTPVPEKARVPARQGASGQVHELENLTLQ